jgi:hypothetical protein
MSAASAVPNHDSTGAARPMQGELFRFRNPVLLRNQRGTVTFIRSHQIQRRERIFLNVYHLHKCLNSCFKCCCMGIFHSGVELFGTEVAFGGSPDDSTGIFLCSPMHTVSPRHFGDQFELLSSTCVGYTKMTPGNLTRLLDLISPEWPANSYNLISRNCNHFVEFFLAQVACRRQPPAFVNRCSRVATSVKCCLPQFITDMNFVSPSDVCVPRESLHCTKNHRVVSLVPFFLPIMRRFSGRGRTCSLQSRPAAQNMEEAVISQSCDPEGTDLKPGIAAGNAALSRQRRFLRSRGLHPAHPAECRPISCPPSFPPKASNIMVVGVASMSQDGENDGSVRMGAFLPADLDAIKIGLSDPQVDVSSDDSMDGTHPPACS